MNVTSFLEQHYRHFNAREMLDAARAWQRHLQQGGKMMVTLAGAMSTAELGRSLAPLIRAGKVHAISTTAANFEEDLFNLLAHNQYRLTTNWRELSAEDEVKLRDEGFNRVTDTCIPETAFREVEGVLLEYWREAAEQGESHFPQEYIFRLLSEGRLREHYQIPESDSWVLAALERRIPVYLPGFEDSTMGNIFAARVIDGSVSTHRVVRSGTEQMQQLVEWYRRTSANASIGFFQIGGGIAGDFAICAVPLMLQDLEEDVPLWGYFAQISDSTTS